MSRTPKIASLGLAAWMAGCTWVDTQPGAERVVLIDSFQAESCERLGTASSQTMDKLWFYKRDQKTVNQELLTLARNRAVAMGGNALLRQAAPVDVDGGRQAYIVYRCPSR